MTDTFQPMKPLSAIGLVALLLTPVLPAQAKPKQDVSNGVKAKTILNQVAWSIRNAKAIEFGATLRVPQMDERGNVMRACVYSIDCREQAPGYQIQTIRLNGQPFGTIACGQDGGVFYDAALNKYITFDTPKASVDFVSVHKVLDGTENPDVGNLFDSTLIDGPMLDLAGQYNRDGAVTYKISSETDQGRKVIVIAQHTSASGAPMDENVYLDTSRHLLAYTVSTVIQGKKLEVFAERFSSLKLLSAPLPLSTFAFDVPKDATEFEQPSP
jgi:hypothetical protein